MSEKNPVIIIGNGKLANLIMSDFRQYSPNPCSIYSPGIHIPENCIFVHIGSGRQYMETLQLAMDNHSIYIQAATEKEYPLPKPETGKGSFVYIDAPNLDIKIIKLFYLLSEWGGLFENENTSILESHQKEKTSQAGTALRFCDYLNIPHEDLVSVRNPSQQKNLGIQNTDHHAYHKIKIGDENSQVIFETKIEGAHSYVQGLSSIVECVPELNPGLYNVEDLVALKLI